jgi:1-acyl-sn-glycerol-3-phosphate acyltransferase
MIAFVRSLLFAILFYLGSAVIVLSGAVFELVSPGAIRRVAYNWGAYGMWLARHVLGIRIAVRGAMPSGAVLIASKHQSAFETIIMPAFFDWPVPVLKEELTSIPFWGWLARRYGSIPVDREGSARSLRAMMAAAKAAVAAGRPIVIFPEGTRTPYGEAPPLKAGVSGLYKMLRLPVVPVALDAGRLWPRRSFIKRAGTITLDFGEPIPPGLDRNDFEARLHAGINRTL